MKDPHARIPVSCAVQSHNRHMKVTKEAAICALAAAKTWQSTLVSWTGYPGVVHLRNGQSNGFSHLWHVQDLDVPSSPQMLCQEPGKDTKTDQD